MFHILYCIFQFLELRYVYLHCMCMYVCMYYLCLFTLLYNTRVLSLLITLIGEFEAEFKFYIGIYI